MQCRCVPRPKTTTVYAKIINENTLTFLAGYTLQSRVVVETIVDGIGVEVAITEVG